MGRAKKPGFKFKKRILVVPVLVLLVLAGVYLNKGLTLGKTAISENPALHINSQIKTNLSSWNKYQGFGFTFEYPTGWKVEEINSSTKHEYNVYDPTSSYEVNYKGVAKSQFYSRSWNIMVFSKGERRNYLDNDKLLTPAQYAKFYCETVKSTGRLMAWSSPQSGKSAFQAKCFTVADEYLIYNDNFFATILFRAYGGKDVEDAEISKFLSSFKINE